MPPVALITGGAGFIGSFLCERFVAEGYEVICVDNFITGREENLTSLADEPRFHLERRDVCDGIHVHGDVDIVLHLASPASPKDYLKYPVETMKVGSYGTLNALDIARDKGAVFLLASTSEVYGDPTMTPQPESYNGNVNPVGPRAVYDEAKRFGEAISSAYHRYFNVSVRIARIFNTYGPRMRPDDGRVIPAFITACLKNRPLPVFGDGRQTRSFCYVEDMVEALWRLATCNENFCVVNLGNPEEMPVLELAQVVQDVCGVYPGVEFKPLPKDDPKRRCPDITQATRLLKWRPRVSIKEGLKPTVSFFQRKIEQQS